MTADRKVGAPNTAPCQLSTRNLVIRIVQRAGDPQLDVSRLTGWLLSDAGSHQRPRHRATAGAAAVRRWGLADPLISTVRASASKRGSR